MTEGGLRGTLKRRPADALELSGDPVSVMSFDEARSKAKQKNDNNNF